MQVVQIFSVDQEIEHVVALPTDLKASFDPVECCGLEELCGLERSEEVPFLLCLWRPVLQGVQDKVFEKFLVAHAHFYWLTRGTMFSVPAFYQRHVKRPPTTS